MRCTRNPSSRAATAWATSWPSTATRMPTTMKTAAAIAPPVPRSLAFRQPVHATNAPSSSQVRSR